MKVSSSLEIIFLSGLKIIEENRTFPSLTGTGASGSNSLGSKRYKPMSKIIPKGIEVTL